MHAGRPHFPCVLARLAQLLLLLLVLMGTGHALMDMALLDQRLLLLLLPPMQLQRLRLRQLLLLLVLRHA